MPVSPYQFPTRLTAKQLPEVYASPEEAMAHGDYIYVARYGTETPELRGCALLMLGNRVGGERVLDMHKIDTAQSYYYRAYAAWQHEDEAQANHWVGACHAKGGFGERLERLITLMRRGKFRMVLHSDFHKDRFIEPYLDIADIEIVVTRQLQDTISKVLPPGQPIKSMLPEGFEADLVLLDDVKMVPVGIGDLNAPVVAIIHDHEWHYEFLDQVLPDIDLLSLGCTQEILEMGKPFGIDCTTYLFLLHMNLPEQGTLAKNLENTSNRTTDLFYSGELCHDFYRFKKQQILPLSKLDEQYVIKIDETFYPVHMLWEEIKKSRFSIMTSRACSYISSRAVESLACGTLHLVEEEDGIPYIFSESFDCFPVYRRRHVVADVANHLREYPNFMERFRKQLPQFQKEFESFIHADNKVRMRRYIRHLLFLTHVHNPKWKTKKKTASRKFVYLNEYYRLVAGQKPGLAKGFIEQTPIEYLLRRALGARSLALAEGKTAEEGFRVCYDIIHGEISKFPDSLALHHAMGVCQIFLKRWNEADRNFIKVISGKLKLYPLDPPLVGFNRLNSPFWIGDARIREHISFGGEKWPSPYDVWVSQAWGNRAKIAVEKGQYDIAIEHAECSLTLLPYNDDVQKIYLRAAFNLALPDNKEWKDRFLHSFAAGCHNDYTMLHDFASAAFHFLMERGRADEALKLLDDLKRYLGRIKLKPQNYKLYEELVPYIRRYNIPNVVLDEDIRQFVQE